MLNGVARWGIAFSPAFSQGSRFAATLGYPITSPSGYNDHLWDKQIEDDLEAGRLDKLLAEVNEEHRAGLARPL